MPAKVSLRHRLEFGLARLIESMVAAAPEQTAQKFGGGLGGLVRRLGVRREVVEQNLRIAFPNAGDEWIAQTTTATFRHLAREAVVMMRLPRMSRDYIIERTSMQGWDEFNAAIDLGRGVILAAGHYGNWEMAAASVAARGVRIAAVVRAQGNGMFDHHLNGVRESLGIETIYQKDARTQVAKVLREGGVVGLMSDQNARRSGVFVPFFGVRASTYRGPALFALRQGSPLFACVAQRLPGNEAHYEVRGRIVNTDATGDMDADVERITAQVALRLEEEIRRAPEQYFWFHKRWKTAPPGETSSPVPYRVPFEKSGLNAFVRHRNDVQSS